MEIVFLGTSCMVPTKERNHSSVFLSYRAEGILVDCGEGTQRQMKLAGLKPTKVTKILISHWHGDHVLGLGGLIGTLGMSEYNRTLQIYGPKGSKEYLGNMLNSTADEVGIKIEIKEVSEGIFYEDNRFMLQAAKLKHRCPTLGYAFIEKDRRRINTSAAKKLGIPEGPLMGKLQSGEPVSFKGKTISPDDATYIVRGKKIAFIMDTVPCESCYRLAEDADLLVCEAAYSSKLEAKAREYLHMTAKEAGLVASRSNVKKLVLTHFSARYKNTHELQEDAQSVFPNIICAEDFMKISV